MAPKKPPIELKRKATPERDVSPPPLKRQLQSTTTSKAVASFFTPTSQKEPAKTKWTVIHETLLVGRHVPSAEEEIRRRQEKRHLVAAFDLDSTLIAPRSGRKFSTEGDPNDWKWFDMVVPEKLKQLDAEGYNIVIFTNQGGLRVPATEKGRTKRMNNFKQKVDIVLSRLDIHITIYAATGLDIFRKPRLGMWTEMLNDYAVVLGKGADLQHSFFVGDAGGRLADTHGPADHDVVDRYFASNAGITFLTPDEFFLQQKPRQFTAFDPHEYLGDEVQFQKPVPPAFSKVHSQEVVVLCGSPGAGKSTFYWTKLEPLGYERVNQDILKTLPKCLQKAKELLDEGRSVAIDATNASVETRSRWIDLAKERGVSARCIHLTAGAELAMHNDAVRAFSGSKELNPEERATLPYAAFVSYTQRFQKPSLKEGFVDVTEAKFKFEGTDLERSIWTKHWV